MSKELGNSIDIIKKVYQGLLLTEESLTMVVYTSQNQYGEDKLRRTLNNIPWLSELGKGYMIATFT